MNTKRSSQGLWTWDFTIITAGSVVSLIGGVLSEPPRPQQQGQGSEQPRRQEIQAADGLFAAGAGQPRPRQHGAGQLMAFYAPY